MLILVRVVEEKKRFGQIGKKILMAVSKIIQEKKGEILIRINWVIYVNKTKKVRTDVTVIILPW